VDPAASRRSADFSNVTRPEAIESLRDKCKKKPAHMGRVQLIPFLGNMYQEQISHSTEDT
jgi:hypothetical protein